MSKNKNLINLFSFLMELLDENTQNTEEVPVTKKSKELLNEKLDLVYRLQNPAIPPHPVLNPMVEMTSPLRGIAPHAVDLIKKMDALDKEHGVEIMKTRTVKKATGPLIDEIKRLKDEAHKNASESMADEVKEYLEVTGERVGMVLDGGEIKPVKIPTELRNNIPIGDDENSEVISKDMQEYLESLSKPINTTPTGDVIPNEIKNVLMNAKKISEPTAVSVGIIPSTKAKKVTRASKEPKKSLTKKRKTNKK